MRNGPLWILATLCLPCLCGSFRPAVAEDTPLPERDRPGAMSANANQETQQHVEASEMQPEKDRMSPAETIRSWPTVAEFEAWKHSQSSRASFSSVAELPIRVDIREAIELGVRHLNNLYDADRDDEPFFYANLRTDGTGEMHHAVNIGIPHVVGRCLLGSMEAERCTGLPFPEEGLVILERYLKLSFDNKNHLNSYYDPQHGNERFIEFHNMREGLYGLWALVAGRDSKWACEKAVHMLETLNAITDEKGCWSPALADAMGMEGICLGMAPPNAARMVDPLMAFHRTTGNALALKLAEAYARTGLRELFEPDGRFAPMPRSSGHVHSITSSLSGITDYALFTGDSEMLKACRDIMDVGVPEYHSSWGWGDEVFPEHPADVAGRGEINQTGDVIRTALMLGSAGYPSYYEMAERYLRSMLLPTQHRETELRRYMHENENPTRDAERDVLVRSEGGFAMQLPNDRMREGDWPLSTLDITSGAVHAMSACWQHCVTEHAGICSVNLLFDHESEDVTVRSALPVHGHLSCTMKTAKALRIRVPGWLDKETISLRVNRKGGRVQIEDHYLDLGPLEPSDEVEISFAVPCKMEREVVDGTTYTTTWVGNQVIEILPRGTVSPLPF